MQGLSERFSYGEQSSQEREWHFIGVHILSHGSLCGTPAWKIMARGDPLSMVPVMVSEWTIVTLFIDARL
jgi:hypothetical protein